MGTVAILKSFGLSCMVKFRHSKYQYSMPFSYTIYALSILQLYFKGDGVMGDEVMKL
jgi:hypothetical protein